MDSGLKAQLLEYEEDFGFEVLAEILSTFMGETPTIFEKLKSDLSNNNLKSATQNAHSLKGSAGYLGITDVYETAGKIEKASEDGDAATCLSKLPELETGIKDSLTLFQEILDAGCVPQVNPV